MSKVFICYRRDDTAGYAGRLHDRLVARFGRESIFRDIDSIHPGVDFVVAIDQAVRGCDALVAVIGKGWLTATDRAGNRRLDDPHDYLRNEISAALSANLLLIPVLVEGAHMPDPDILPTPLARLSRYNAIELSDDRWDYDMNRLITRLEAAVADRDQVVMHVPGFEAATVARSGSRWTQYRARREGTSRCVTVKVLRVPVIGPAERERFTRECALIAGLSWHPNLASVHGSGMTDDGHPYMVLEDLDGSTIEDRLRRSGALPWREAVAVGLRLARALETAHAGGLLHCDISPARVHAGQSGEPLLSDFGLARLENEANILTTGALTSAAHAAPEVLAFGTHTQASDIYSLGSTLFALLAGAPAFAGDGERRFVAVVAGATTRPVPDLRPRGIPPAVCKVVERAMAKDPDGRFSSAAEFGEALKHALETEIGLHPTLSPEPPPAPEAVVAPEPAPPPIAEPVVVAPEPAPPPIAEPVVTPANALPTGPVDAPPPAPPPPPPVAPPPAFPPSARRGRSGRGRMLVAIAACVSLVALAAVGVVALTGDSDQGAIPPKETDDTVVAYPDRPEVLLEDSLAAPMSPAWSTSDLPDGSAAYAGGGYRITLKQPGIFLDFGAPLPSDRLGPGTVVEVTATSERSDAPVFGLFCKSSKSDAFPRYAAYVRPDGFWSIRRYDKSGAMERLAESVDESQLSPALHASGPNRIRFDCLGGTQPMTLALWANGQELARVPDPEPYAVGDVGVTAAAADNPPAVVTFTDFVARRE